MLIVQKTPLLQGQITIPGSKSQTIRALLFALLSPGKSILKNCLWSEDTYDAMVVCRQLGASLIRPLSKLPIETSDTLILKSEGSPLPLLSTQINSGNSGITTHFVMPLLGLRQLSDQPVILNCGEQMRARPIASFVCALRHLGLVIDYVETENTLPVRISGNLIGGKVDLDGVNSQYLSALLVALPCAQEDSEIRVKQLNERPYVDMTLQYLNDQGIVYSHQFSQNTDVYWIQGRQRYTSFCTAIAGDFSSASYFIAAATLIPGEVILRGLNWNDSQGDKQLVTILQSMGADILIEPTQLLIRGGKKLSSITIDARDIPDLLPTLAVVGAVACEKMHIVNVAHARIKETDRIASMADGLRRMGVKLEVHTDGLTLYQSTLMGADLKGYGDHRTVMALSVAGMLADGITRIDTSEAMDKTFPTFVSLMQSLGGNLANAAVT